MGGLINSRNPSAEKAAPTPTYDEGRIYAMGGNGEFRCLDADSGRTIWRRKYLTENHAEVPKYGEAVSPLIVEDKVIVLPGGTNGFSSGGLQ